MTKTVSIILTTIGLVFCGPAVPLLIVGTVFGVGVSFRDVFVLGHFSTLWLLAPIIGGWIGVFGSLSLAKSNVQRLEGRVARNRCFALVGCACLLYMIFEVDPNAEPLLMYWVPPFIGVFLVLLASIKFRVNKSIQQCANAPVD